MKILIIEDEAAAARRLQKLINDIDQGHEIIGVLSSIEASTEWLASNPPPELIMMDIHLADGSSFEIFEKADITSPVVFATAYDEYALKAFKVNAIDYLLKPIKQIELEKALQKVAAPVKHAATGDDLIHKLEEAGFIRKSKRLLVKM